MPDITIVVPPRGEMTAAMLALVPFAGDESFRVVDLGSGEGLLAVALLERFPRATVLALDGSASMRAQTTKQTARFGSRAQVRAFDLATLDWWDLMRGADLVVSALCLHRLNDAKKQYLYKAVADRLSPRGAFLIADLVDVVHPAGRRPAADRRDAGAAEQADAHPSPLFHHLVWLKHAGFAAVDVFWIHAGHAVYGGFK